MQDEKLLRDKSKNEIALKNKQLLVLLIGLVINKNISISKVCM